MSLILLLLLLEFILSKKIVGTVYLDHETANPNDLKFTFKNTYDEDGVAFATYFDEFYETGWDYLYLKTNKNGKFSDQVLAAGAGYLEGILLKDSIYPAWKNTFYSFYHETNYSVPQYIKDYIKEQEEWQEKMVKENSEDEYWQQVETMTLMQKFIVNGYNDYTHDEKRKISQTDYRCYYDDGINDLFYLDKNRREREMSVDETLDMFYRNTHCSAIFKLTADMKDIYFGHTTWSNPAMMLRTFKKYELNYANKMVKSPTVSFPGYPGVTNSIDDMYSNREEKIIVIETTNGIFDTSLYKKLNPHTVAEWQRIMLANRLASNGNEWHEIFKKFNDGCYNNQWMVLDLKLFKPGEDLEPNLFVVGEQIPGDYIYADATKVLERGYWPSYNVPFFKEIYNATGYRKQVDEHPETKIFYDYENCVRAQLMRKYHTKIESIDDMQEFITYNNYLKDPLELKNPALAIAARHDLDLEAGRCHMNTDAKISSYSHWVDEGKWRIMSGPTYGGESNVPPFSWKDTVNCDLDYQIHLEHPDVFKFGWVTYDPNRE